MKKKISSRGRKNEWVTEERYGIPSTKAGQIKFALGEIKEWVKFLNDIDPKNYCQVCKAELSSKKK